MYRKEFEDFKNKENNFKDKECYNEISTVIEQ